MSKLFGNNQIPHNISNSISQSSVNNINIKNNERRRVNAQETVSYGATDDSINNSILIPSRTTNSEKRLFLEETQNNQEIDDSHEYISLLRGVNNELSDTTSNKRDQYALLIGNTNKDRFYLQSISIKFNDFYQEFERWLFQDPLLKKICIYFLLDKFPGATWREKLVAHLKYFFQGVSLPQQNIFKLKKIADIENFLQGSQYVARYLWPAALGCLLSHDLINYALYPEQHYGTQATDIWLGIAKNQNVWTGQWGSDIPVEGMYWIAAFVMTLMTVGNGLRNLIWQRRQWKPLLSNQPLFLDEGELASNSNLLVRFNAVSQAEFMLRWNKSLSHDEAQNLIESLAEYAQSGATFWSKWLALRALATVADTFRPAVAELFNKDTPINYPEIGNLALAKLKNLKFDILAWKQSILYLYLNYLVWSLGRQDLLWPNNLLLKPIFWFFSSALLYANIRLWQLWGSKLLESFIFLHHRQQCLDQEKVWTYLEALGNYACTPCGDWDFVPVFDRFTAQGCVSALLSEKRTVGKIQDYLTKISKFSKDIATVDLSKQAWEQWSAAEFNNIFSLLENQFSYLKDLNLSRPIFNAYGIEPAKMQTIKALFQKITLEAVDFTNCNLGASYIHELLNKQQHSLLQTLILSGCSATDEVVPTIIKFLQDNAVRKIILDNNQITNAGIASFAELRNSSLEIITTRSNAFDGIGFDNFVNNILPYNPIRIFDVSGNQLANADFNNFWNASTVSSLKNFIAINCGLTDDLLYTYHLYANQSNIEELILADNQFTDDGVINFVGASIGNSSVISIDVSGSYLTDMFADGIAQYLPTSNLKYIGLDRTSMTAQGAKFLFDAFCNSTLTGFGVAEIGLDNEAIETLSNMFLNCPRTWQKINLSTNSLFKGNVSLLGQGLSNNNIGLLDLSDNSLKNDFANAHTQGMADRKLNSIILTNNLISDEGASAYAKVIQSASMQQVILDDNPVSDMGAIDIGIQLIKPIPEMNKLSQPSISRDQRRALAHASPASQMQLVSLNHANITDVGARQLCRVSGPAKVALNLNDNSAIKTVNIHNCRISSADTRISRSVYFHLARLPQYAKDWVKDWFSASTQANKALTPATNEKSVKQANFAKTDDNVTLQAARYRRLIKVKQAAKENRKLKSKNSYPFFQTKATHFPQIHVDHAQSLPQYLPLTDKHEQYYRYEDNSAQVIMLGLVTGLLGLVATYLLFRTLSHYLPKPSLNFSLWKTYTHSDDKNFKEQEPEHLSGIKTANNYYSHKK